MLYMYLVEREMFAVPESKQSYVVSEQQVVLHVCRGEGGGGRFRFVMWGGGERFRVVMWGGERCRFVGLSCGGGERCRFVMWGGGGGGEV